MLRDYDERINSHYNNCAETQNQKNRRINLHIWSRKHAGTENLQYFFSMSKGRHGCFDRLYCMIQNQAQKAGKQTTSNQKSGEQTKILHNNPQRKKLQIIGKAQVLDSDVTIGQTVPITSTCSKE